jgi:polyhydroxyalkanoate synthesis regulator phasin
MDNKQNALQQFLGWSGDKINQGKEWVNNANKRVIDQLRDDPYSLSLSSGIRRMSENENNPWIARKMAAVAYMNPILSGTDFEVSAKKREQEKQIEKELRANLPPEQWEKYLMDKRIKTADELAQKVVFSMGTINPVPGSMADDIVGAVKSGKLSQADADDYMQMLQQKALEGRSPVGNPELFTKNVPMKAKTVNQLRADGIAQVDDLAIAPRADSLSRARIDEYKSLIEQGADVPPVVLSDKVGENGIEIFDGNHRAMAYKELGMPVPISEMTVKEYQKFLTANPQFAIDTAKQSFVKINVAGKNTQVPLLEKYKGKDIVQSDGLVSVYDPQKKTLFQVALDDSKSTGERFVNQGANNIENAKKYIDEAQKSTQTLTNPAYSGNVSGTNMESTEARDLIKKTLGGGEHKDWFMELEDGINKMKADGGASNAKIKNLIKKTYGGGEYDDWFNELTVGIDELVNGSPLDAQFGDVQTQPLDMTQYFKQKAGEGYNPFQSVTHIKNTKIKG